MAPIWDFYNYYYHYQYESIIYGLNQPKSIILYRN